MAFSMDHVPLDFDCPQCGHKLKHPLSWFKDERNKCPSCGLAFKMKGASDTKRKPDGTPRKPRRRLK